MLVEAPFFDKEFDTTLECLEVIVDGVCQGQRVVLVRVFHDKCGVVVVV